MVQDWGPHNGASPRGGAQAGGWAFAHGARLSPYEPQGPAFLWPYYLKEVPECCTILPTHNVYILYIVEVELMA